MKTITKIDRPEAPQASTTTTSAHHRPLEETGKPEPPPNIITDRIVFRPITARGKQ